MISNAVTRKQPVVDKIFANKNPYQHAVHLMPSLIKHMRWSRGDLVLDYGCNDGNTGYHAILPHVKKWKGHLYGVDIEQSSVDKAKAKFSHPLITYGRGTITHGNSTFSDFPWPELRFNKIFAIYMLHFVHDMPPVLTRFHEALKPGGQFGFISLTVQSWAFSVMMDLYKIDEWRSYMPDWTTKYYPEWSKFKSNAEGEMKMMEYLTNAGFEVAFLKIENWVVYSSEAKFYIDSFNYLSPSLQDLPKDVLPRLRDDVAKSFKKYTGYDRDATNVNITYQYVMGVARKPHKSRKVM